MSTDTIEQNLQNFMIKNFHPSGIYLRGGHENISETLRPYFMPFPVNKNSENVLIDKIPNTIHQNSIKINNEDNAENSKKLNTVTKGIENNKTDKTDKKDKKVLDQYWGFWSAYLSTHGMESYEKIPEKERFRFRLQEKAKASQWMVEDFKKTKTIMAPHWYRLNNRDLEDMATSLMTNADESKEGLYCMVLMWNYYTFQEITETQKSQNELLWVFPGKKVYYKIKKTNESKDENRDENMDDNKDESRDENVSTWGVFVYEKEFEKNMKKIKNRTYEIRRLNENEKEEIEKNMFQLCFVDKALMAVSKYSLKELVDMGEIFGIRPPYINHTINMEMLVLEEEKRITDLEMSLGHKKTKKDLEENLNKGKGKEEKWKKGEWYDNLGVYLSGILD